MDENKISEKIIGAAVEVHRHLGPGLLENIYQECLHYELVTAGLHVEKEVMLPVVYKGRRLESSYRLDLLVNSKVIVELKAVDKISPLHNAQLISYLKVSDLKLGLILNFNTPCLKQGIKRVIN
jgi:GxxExxY protein